MARTAPTRLLDVANAAGVSLRTASRVLNDDPRVAPVTRQRVREAMLDLRFEPDAMARSLRAGTDTAIGFVVESIADPFFAEVIDAVELEMSRHGRSVLVTSTRRDPGWERDVIGRMVQRRVAGLLLCPTGDDHSWLDLSVPVVLVDRPAPGLSADLVEIDDHRAAFDAVAHLIAHGHRRIAYVGDTPAIPTSAARLRGYRDALARHQVEADEYLVYCDGATSQAAARAVSALIGGPRAADRDPERHHAGVAGRGADAALRRPHGHRPRRVRRLPHGRRPASGGHRGGPSRSRSRAGGRGPAAGAAGGARASGRAHPGTGQDHRTRLRGTAPMTTTDVVIGMDIGTTSAKAGGPSRRRRRHGAAPTTWSSPPPGTPRGCGQTEIDPYRLVEGAVELIARAVRAAESAWGPVRVRSIGVAGLAESGVLLDAAGRPGRAGDRLVRSPRRG